MACQATSSFYRVSIVSTLSQLVSLCRTFNCRDGVVWVTGIAKVRSWDHTSLYVADLDQAVQFYKLAFGFEVVFEARELDEQIASITGVSGMTGDLVHLRCPNSSHTLELLQFTADALSEHGGEYAALGTAHVSFVVEDLDQAVVALQDLGAKQLGFITEFAEGRAVYLVGPAGTVVELEEGTASDT